MDPEKDLTRLREALAGKRGITEKRMFGGICFLLNDHMLCGTSKRGYLFRVGEEREARGLAQPGASIMEMGGRTFRGYLRVDPDHRTTRDLAVLIALATDYVGTLPPKKEARRAAKKKPARKQPARRR